MGYLNKTQQYIFMLSLLGLGLVLSIAGYMVVQSRENHISGDVFDQAAKARVVTIKNDFDSNIDVLHNLRSLYF